MDYGKSQKKTDTQSSVLGDLIALLDANREEIATVWAHAIRKQMHDSSYGQYPFEQISAYNEVGAVTFVFGPSLFKEENLFARWIGEPAQ